MVFPSRDEALDALDPVFERDHLVGEELARGLVGELAVGELARRVADEHLGLHEPVHSKLRKEDRKSTRLNSSHLVISYAVFCLKKKKEIAHLYNTFHCVCTSLPLSRTLST